ncbi:hypothetical protein ACJZ2D_010758 [Fusarium nematophilum]
MDASDTQDKTSQAGPQNNAWQNINTGAGRQYNASNMQFHIGSHAEMTGGDAEIYRDLVWADPSDDRKALKLKQGTRANGTCEWILDAEELKAWSKPEPGSNRILWISGHPGKGKSAMAVYLTETFSSIFTADTGKILAYFFCNSNDQKRNTAEGILRGLLWQIFQSHPELLSDDVRQRYKNRGKVIFENFVTLWDLLEGVATNTKHHVFCIIDALDECDEDSRNDLLLKQIDQTFKHPSPAIKLSFLILSRPDPKIHYFLGEFRHRDLESFPQSGKDVERYIDQQLKQLSKRKSYSSATTASVRQILQAKAEGTFLWVGLACEELHRLQSKDAVNFLQGLPKGLSALYSTIYNGLLSQNEDYVLTMKRIVGTVVTSLRPLSLLELSDACLLDLEQDEETRMQHMRDYVVNYRIIIVAKIKETYKTHERLISPGPHEESVETIERERVVLLHQSVKDFLFTKQSYPEMELHASIANRCLDELSWHLPKRQENAQSAGCLLSYAVGNWTHHVRLAGEKFEVQASHDEFFAVSSDCREAWLVRVNCGRLPGLLDWSLYFGDPRLPLVNIAARWQVPVLLDYVASGRQKPGSAVSMSKNHKWSGRFGPMWSPLVDAIVNGGDQMLAVLLRRGLPLTEGAIIAAGAYDRDKHGTMLPIIMTLRLEEIVLHPNLAACAARYLSVTMMEVILNHPSFKWNNWVMVGVAENEQHGLELTKLLLTRFGNEIYLDEAIMEDISKECAHPETIDYLLVEHRDHIRINENTAMAGIYARGGPGVLRALLKHRGRDITITEDLMVAAMDTWDRERFMALFLELPKAEVHFTKRVVFAVLPPHDDDDDDDVSEVDLELLEMLLAHRGADIEIDQDIVVQVAGTLGYVGLRILFAYKGESVQITQRVLDNVVRFCSAEEFMELLEKADEDGFEITQEMLENTVGDSRDALELMPLFVERSREGPVHASCRVVGVALKKGRPYYVLTLILLLRDRGGEMNITKESMETWFDDSLFRRKTLAFFLVVLHKGWCKISGAGSRAEQAWLQGCIKRNAESKVAQGMVDEWMLSVLEKIGAGIASDSWSLRDSCKLIADARPEEL